MDGCVYTAANKFRTKQHADVIISTTIRAKKRQTNVAIVIKFQFSSIKNIFYLFVNWKKQRKRNGIIAKTR